MSETRDKHFDPRHRVVGAVILIGLAVIFVPMILAGRGASERPEAQVPSNSKRVVVELTQTAPATTLAAASPAPSVDATPPAPPPATTAAEPPTPTLNAPVAMPSVSTRWFVQAGIFSDAANARALAQRLRKRGYNVQLDKLPLAGGTGTRVRVGPYSERAAKEAQARLHAQFKIKGLVKSEEVR